MKGFCKDVKEHAAKIINFERKEMMLLTNEENKSYIKQEVCHICKKKKSTDDKKVRDHYHYTGKYRGAAHNNCNLNYKESKEIPIIFHNGSTYDYHFIKELAKEFTGQFECLGENTKKYITFFVPSKKHKLKFIDSFRFVTTSLSSLANNFCDGLYNDKCTDCKSCLAYISTKDNQLIFKCLKCNKNHTKDFNNDLINRFASTYKFCDKKQ